MTCWGAGSIGRSTLDVPPSLEDAAPGAARDSTTVAAGWLYVCSAPARTATVACSGDADAIPAGAPAGRHTAVTAGRRHACALAAPTPAQTAGTVACWGDNTSGQTTVPQSAYTAVTAGYQHTCALAADQTIACWGDNRDGQATPPAGAYLSVSAGGWHTCALAADQTFACWGDNHPAMTPPTTRTAKPLTYPVSPPPRGT